jgi:hypothetical protein
MEYKYKRLPFDSIRVLELQPGEHGAPLAGHMVTQSISAAPYEAISYVWGDPVRNRVILCDGKSLAVTSNLREALDAVRDRNSVRRFWADAICINQSDVEELGAQVSLMGLIYSSAQSVIGWLGPDPGMAGDIVNHIIRFNQQPVEFISHFREQLESGSVTDTSLAPGPDSPIWQAIKDFVKLPYFHRVWIIQELGLAAKARLLCGKHEIAWLEFTKFCAFLDHNAAFIVNHLQLETWVVNHTAMIWFKLPNGEFKQNFLQVLHLARIHQASDPRDRIYAFLSHPSALVSGSLITTPDYRLATAELYIRFAMTYIERTKNLQVVTLVDHDEVSLSGALPSWVPDWHAINRVSMTPGMRDPMAEEESDSSISFVTSGAKPVLVVRGVVVDSVLAVSPVLGDKDFAVTTLERERQKSCPFFLDRLWQMLGGPRNTNISTEETIRRLSSALAAGLRKYTSLEGANLEQHHLDFAAYVRKFEDIRPKDSAGGMLASLPVEVQLDLEEKAPGGNPAQYVQDITWMCKSRVVFCTKQHGIIGIGPRCMRPGDVCCSIAGSPMPLILRPVADEGHVGAKAKYALVGPAEASGMGEQRLGVDEIHVI